MEGWPPSRVYLRRKVWFCGSSLRNDEIKKGCASKAVNQGGFVDLGLWIINPLAPPSGVTLSQLLAT